MKTSGPLLDSFPIATFLLALALAAAPQPASAACSQPLNPTFAPQPVYTSATGSIDTAFLIPGKIPGPNADREATVFGPAASATAPASGDIVTVGFTQGTTKALLVLADDCSTVPACANTTVECEKTSLVFTAAGGGLPASVRFAPGKGLKKLDRVGPVRLAVSTPANLPCELADPAKSCGDFASLHACIDKVTPADGRAADATIDSITALPEPNDFKKLCKSSNAADDRCQGGEMAKLHFALDAHGDIVMPIYWGKLLKKLDGTSGDCEERGNPCDKRKVVANTNLPAGLGGLAAIQIGCAESPQHLQSFAADGTVFSSAPLFQVDPGNANPSDELRLLGSIDKAFSVLRIRRCPQSNLNCGTMQKFDLSARIEDGNPISLGRRGNRLGYCDESGTLCAHDSECIGKACLYAEGEEHGPFTGSSSLMCDQGTSPDDGSGVWVLILILIGGFVILVWVFRRR
jgi:hypothetical protein